MKIAVYITALALLISSLGCATATKKVAIAAPKPAEGEVAVFGKISIKERIGFTFMPMDSLKGSLYLSLEGSDKTYKINAAKTGEFGVYLPYGNYTVTEIDTNGYTFYPNVITLYLPKNTTAIYAGTVSLDGTPSGVVRGMGRSRFAYSIKDEYGRFEERINKASKDGAALFTKSLFAANGSVAEGSYPDKVFRTEDIERELYYRGKAVEDFAQGTLIVLTYMLNPAWILVQ